MSKINGFVQLFDDRDVLIHWIGSNEGHSRDYLICVNSVLKGLYSRAHECTASQEILINIYIIRKNIFMYRAYWYLIMYSTSKTFHGL